MVLALFADSATNKLKVNQINRIFIMLLSQVWPRVVWLSLLVLDLFSGQVVEIPVVVSADER